MKKIKLISILGLTLASTLSLSLLSCSKSEKAQVKDVYGVNDDKQVAKMGECEVYFKENSSIPYISLNDGVDLMDKVRKTFDKDKCFAKLEKVENNYVITNENNAKCTINKENQTLSFDDFDSFNDIIYGTQNPISLITPKKGEYKVIKSKTNNYTKGNSVEIHLNDYSKLDIVEFDEKEWIPLSVYNSALLNITSSVNLAYNGKSYFLITADSLVDPLLGLESEFGEKFREGVATNSISEEMVEYYYDSLCFDFNNEYGLVERFNNFDQFLETFAYKNKIKNTSPKEIDKYTAIALSWLEDNHTALTQFSNLYEFGDNTIDETLLAPAKNAFYSAKKSFVDLKKTKNIKQGLSYVNDTVFVTFDEFTELDQDMFYLNVNQSEEDRAMLAELDLDVSDTNTALLFNKLYKDIQKDEHKNVKNIVIDLTSNDGGSADSLIYSLSTLIGDVALDMRNSITGGLNHQVYKADINGDTFVDDKDVSLIDLGYSIYFLNSSYSFSSANAMPVLAALNSNKVINLGANTAGGPCAIRQYITPIGSNITASSLHTLSKLENGKYVNINGGVKPDFEIAEEKMIDREFIQSQISTYKK